MQVVVLGVASRWVAVLGAVLTLAILVYPTAGRADTPVLPADAGLPWIDPAHQGALEQLLAPIASHIAGRPVTVRCEGDYDWSVLAAQRHFDPNAEAGYVDSPNSFVATNRYVSSATMMELSPIVCSHLQSFAQASVKPTKCQASTSTTVHVTRERAVTRYRVLTLKRPTRVDGRLLKPGVWNVPYQVKVPYAVAESRTVLDPPAPCFLGTPTTTGGVCWTVPTATGTPEKTCYDVIPTPSASYWQEYSLFAQAIQTVAHEAIHLWQAQAGAQVPPAALVESQAECSGMQWFTYVATQLGDTPDDAQAVATFYWEVEYPNMISPDTSYESSHPYWSADCISGGPLDIRSDKTGFWP